MITLTAADIDGVRRVRARISDPKHWTQGPAAKNADGRRVNARDPAACSWCILGAFQCELANSRINPVMGAIATSNAYRSIITTNERDGHAAVLERLDRFIAAHETASA